jgi:hypothetical protein
MVELEQNGSWYRVSIEYNGDLDVFKAHGKQELNELIEDLIHDCKIDEQFHLIPALEQMKN